jgi:excisionase family DNA binding protein
MTMREIERDANSPLLLSLADAAKATNLCERTVWSIVHSGELPHIRVGRRVLISRAALERWIAEKETGGRAEPRAIG